MHLNIMSKIQKCPFALFALFLVTLSIDSCGKDSLPVQPDNLNMGTLTLLGLEALTHLWLEEHRQWPVLVAQRVEGMDRGL